VTVAAEAPRLAIELVPETCWLSSVGEAMSTADWAELRRRVVRDAGYRCEVCRRAGRALECRAVWEYDDEHHVQRLVSMAALCAACYQVKDLCHVGADARSRDVLSHLALVNGWSADRSERHRAAAFREWRERSRHRWSLDLDALRDYGLDPDGLISHPARA
jgi:hypothetical protein